MKLKLNLVLFLLLCGGWPAHAQQVSGTITAVDTQANCTTAGGYVSSTLLSNASTIAFQVSSTYSGTLNFVVTLDGSTWSPANAYPPNSTTAVTSTTGTGKWKVDAGGWRGFCVYASALASGTPTVLINQSPGVSTSTLSGGGGGGAGVSSFSGDGTIITNSGSTGAVTATVAGHTGTGNIVLATSPSLVTPALGAATATSMIATGIVDGTAPVTITTGASCTLGTASGCNATAYSTGFTFNQEATAATAITYTLPTAAAGKSYCVSNSYNGSAATTGTLELLTSATGQFIIFTDGTPSATGGYVQSGGAAGDAACVEGVDATHWQLYVNRGTWTKH